MPPLPLNHITTHEDNRSFQQHAHSPLVEALGAVARCIPTLGSLVLLSSCVLGTTARDRIYPPIELTFNVSSKWFRAPAEGATIKIDRYYPALVLGTYVPVVEGKTDSQGQFRTAIHLSGRY